MEATRDRKPFPAIRLANYTETHHFGGILRNDPDMPKNYISMSAIFQPKHMPNWIARLLFQRLQDKMSDQIMDFTFVLEGEQEDELPERALCTTRMVHVDTQAAAKLATYHIKDPPPKPKGNVSEKETESFRKWAQDSLFHVVELIGSPLRLGGVRRSIPDISQTTLDVVEELQANEEGLLVSTNLGSSRVEVAMNDVANILKDVKVPAKSSNARRNTLPNGARLSVSENRVSEETEGMTLLPVSKLVNPGDLKLFVEACNFDMKTASVRLVRTAAWRGKVFPVDIRKCRIELQSGQFFQQGFDRVGSPVFYFRVMSLGPWRGNVEASILAFLHRFEAALKEFCDKDPTTRMTLLFLMGPPFVPNDFTDSDEQSDTGRETKSNGGDEHSLALGDDGSHMHQLPVSSCISNPRISHSETWQKHVNTEMIDILVDVLSANYPGRIRRILVMKGPGKAFYFAKKLKNKMLLNKFLTLSETRNKVRFLERCTDLKAYVDDQELVTILGGSAPITPAAFQFT